MCSYVKSIERRVSVELYSQLRLLITMDFRSKSTIVRRVLGSFFNYKIFLINRERPFAIRSLQSDLPDRIV